MRIIYLLRRDGTVGEDDDSQLLICAIFVKLPAQFRVHIILYWVIKMVLIVIQVEFLRQLMSLDPMIH